MIQVRVIPFGVLKDRLGHLEFPLEIPEGSKVSDLLDLLSESLRIVAELSSIPSFKGNPDSIFRGIAVSVNAEYARSSQILNAGDEVGLLPPVSGGAAVSESASTFLTRDPIDAASLIAAAKNSSDGAVVIFDGIVRNHTRGRQTLHLDYEAYEDMAEKQMRDLAIEARKQFAVRHVTIVHRLGRLHIGETSVLIIVASAHRAAAFEACRWLIDTLKKTVPIWKKETFVDGAVWAAGEPFPDELAVVPPESPHEK
jgi:molybdopterin synthase catalytic subunit